MSYTIHHGNVLDFCNNYRGSKFHASLNDPPYHLTSITERFSKKNSRRASYGRDGAFGRVSKGFMGSTWDGGDVAFQVATWQAISSVMHPGAFGFSFAGSRGYHRMTSAIEGTMGIPITDLINVSDLLEMAIRTRNWRLVNNVKQCVDKWLTMAGSLQKAGMIIHPMIIWVFMNGFPKPTRIDTQIDEAAGIKVERGKEFNYKGNVIYGKYADRTDVHYVAQTEAAKAWAGHRYGLQALKPAFEPICVWQVPYPSTGQPFKSIMRTGAGALDLEHTRIEGADPYRRNNSKGQNGVFNASGGAIESDGDRWPPHLILSDEYIYWSEMGEDDAENFFSTNWMLEQLENSNPMVISTKASVSEREAGLDAMQRRLVNEGDDDLTDLEGVINDGRIAESDRPYLRNQTIRRNIHATIKPILLTMYLAKMLLPPDSEQYKPRSLFVPFSGVGSEMIGGVLGGWEHVEGVELEENHARIARVRLDFWSHLLDIHGPDVLNLANLGSTKSRKKTGDKVEAIQHELF